MKITKRHLRKLIREERRHVINEARLELEDHFDVARDELSEAKAVLLRHDKYFSDLAADLQSRGNDWLAEETTGVFMQLRQASDLLDSVIANIDTIQRNS